MPIDDSQQGGQRGGRPLNFSSHTLVVAMQPPQVGANALKRVAQVIAQILEDPESKFGVLIHQSDDCVPGNKAQLGRAQGFRRNLAGFSRDHGAESEDFSTACNAGGRPASSPAHHGQFYFTGTDQVNSLGSCAGAENDDAWGVQFCDLVLLEGIQLFRLQRAEKVIMAKTEFESPPC